VKKLISDYIVSNKLVHPREQQYIVLDQLLQNVMRKQEEQAKFLRREEVVNSLLENMQSWYCLALEGSEAVIK
jgi:translation initiation factor 2D